MLSRQAGGLLKKPPVPHVGCLPFGQVATARPCINRSFRALCCHRGEEEAMPVNSRSSTRSSWGVASARGLVGVRLVG